MRSVEESLDALVGAGPGEGAPGDAAERGAGVPAALAALLGYALAVCATSAFTRLMSLGGVGGETLPPQACLVSFLLSGGACGVVAMCASWRGNVVPGPALATASSMLLAAGPLLAVAAGGMDAAALACVGVVLAGCGDAGMLLLWGRALSSQPPALALVVFAAAYAAGVSGGAWAAGLTPVACAVAVCACALGSGVSFAACCRLSPGLPRPAEAPDALPERYVEALRFLWKPLAAGVICSFIAGLSRTFPTSVGDSALQVAGRFAVAAALALAVFLPGLSRGRHGVGQGAAPAPWSVARFDVRSFYQVVIPIAAIVLLIMPFMLDMADGPLATLFHLVNVAGFALMDVAVLSMLATAVWVLEVPSDAAFGAQRVLGSLVMLTGTLLSPSLSGDALRSACALLLAVYLACVVVSVVRRAARMQQAVRGEQGDAGPVPDARIAGPTLEETCAALARGRGLTAREAEVLPFLARGRGSTWIAERLCISIQTVKTHAKHIHDKLGVSSREELIDLVEAASGCDAASQVQGASQDEG